MDKTIGLFGGTDIIGAVLVDAVTGECVYYDVADVPTWVDHVYTADLIIQQYDYHGLYINGFINSLFGQREVTVSTDGYNYIAIGDDVYMYTGITSVVSDESNIGFILSNQRTKETRFYSVAGAEEYSAMASAEGQVQHLHYQATFPLLLNISQQPTYFMALKDEAGLVKMYAMVNVSQYQIVATGTTVGECESNYRQMLLQNNLIDEGESTLPEEELAITEPLTSRVTEIRSAVMAGETHYFIRFGDGWYSSTASALPQLILLSEGDWVTIRAYAAAGGIAQKDQMMMQIYADVLGREIRIAGTKQAGALGSAIYAAAAAGAYPSIPEASRALARPDLRTYRPIEENVRAYAPLFEKYKLLHDLFGRDYKDALIF